MDIWDKSSEVSVKSKESKMVASRLQNNSVANTSQVNYTMEELVKRVRRIEKLTERMSIGEFGNSLKIQEAEVELMSALQ